MLKKVFILPLFLLVLCTSCHKNATNTATSGVPNVSVGFTINVYGGLYTKLLIPGGWVYVTGGYDGIIIFCNAQNSYLAFDRGCPYDCETNNAAIINVQSSGITAVCPECGTTYSLYSGTITKGPGSIALKQYYTSFDGTNLTISNNP